MSFRKVKNDKYYRSLYNRAEKKKKICTFLNICTTVNESISVVSLARLAKIKKKASVTMQKNRCHITYRARGVISRFRLSRHAFKKISNLGEQKSIKKE